MDASIKQPINEFVRRLTGVGRIYSVVLFGSRARGTSAPYSDVDILLVVEKLPDSEFGRRKLAVEAAKPIS